MLALVLLIVWLASAFFCASLADSKGYSYATWFIGIFSLVIFRLYIYK
tara:strand:- start:332 stop:475 length:144 start_codon:yes stop_codon:yes gene_type:complete